MKIAMLFPGYASQYVGMAKELLDQSRLIQEYFDEAQNCTGLNITKLAFSGSHADLNQMLNAYIGQFVVSASIAAYLKQENITPHVVAGYNGGIYATLFTAGGISFADALYLIRKYVTLYQEFLENSPSVSILKIKNISKNMLELACNECDHGLSIAIYENDTTFIVSGLSAGIDALKELLAKNKETEIEDLSLEYGLHSDLLEPIVDQFALYLQKVDFKDLEIPLIDQLSNKTIQLASYARQMIIDMLTRPINWVELMKDFSGIDVFIQIGPGTNLIEIAQKYYPSKKAFAINTPADLQQLKTFMENKD